MCILQKLYYESYELMHKLAKFWTYNLTQKNFTSYLGLLTKYLNSISESLKSSTECAYKAKM